MKFSQQWLEETLGETFPTELLIQQLTMAGLEVESCDPVASQFSQIIIGQIETSEQHPDADKLSVNQVNFGDIKRQIVCGAKNARAGLKVAAAIPGAILNIGSQNEMKITEAKLRGVLSQGMCCSVSELGLADTSEGILELPEDAPVGTDLIDYLKLTDKAIELGITPNRGDCLSMRGLARDVAAIF